MLKYMFPAWKAVMSAAASTGAPSGTYHRSGPPARGTVMGPAPPRPPVWPCASVPAPPPELTVNPLPSPVAVFTVRTPPPSAVEFDPVVSWVLSREANLVITVGAGGAVPAPSPLSPHAARAIDARTRMTKLAMLLFTCMVFTSVRCVDASRDPLPERRIFSAFPRQVKIMNLILTMAEIRYGFPGMGNFFYTMAEGATARGSRASATKGMHFCPRRGRCFPCTAGRGPPPPPAGARVVRVLDRWIFATDSFWWSRPRTENAGRFR